MTARNVCKKAKPSGHWVPLTKFVHTNELLRNLGWSFEAAGMTIRKMKIRIVFSKAPAPFIKVRARVETQVRRHG
jgi:hypothetical protein